MMAAQRSGDVQMRNRNITSPIQTPTTAECPSPGHPSASTPPSDSSFSGKTATSHHGQHLNRQPGGSGGAHIRPRAPEIYNLRATVTVLLQAGAFEAVEGVGYALAATY